MSAWDIGAVQSKKNYVSFHLMPVYAFPELLDDLSPALRKRMQGKSCFNFSEVDEPLVAELTQLVAAGARRYEAAGYMLSEGRGHVGPSLSHLAALTPGRARRSRCRRRERQSSAPARSPSPCRRCRSSRSSPAGAASGAP